GAGTLISANHVYKVAKPDGLTIGHFVGGLMLQHVLGKPGIEFDGRHFEHLGVPAQDTTALGVSKGSGVTSIEQWLSTRIPLKFGGVGPGTATDDVTKVVRSILGLPIQLVSGYKGTAEIRLAVNSSELQGVTNSWASVKSTRVQEEEPGALIVLALGQPERHPDIPNVPLIIDFVKAEDGKRHVQVAAHDFTAIARHYVWPPGPPEDRGHIQHHV